MQQLTRRELAHLVKAASGKSEVAAMLASDCLLGVNAVMVALWHMIKEVRLCKAQQYAL